MLKEVAAVMPLKNDNMSYGLTAFKTTLIPVMGGGRSP